MLKYLFYINLFLLSCTLSHAGNITIDVDEEQHFQKQPFYVADDESIRKTLCFIKTIEKETGQALALEFKKIIFRDYDISLEDVFAYIEKTERSFKGKLFRFKNGFGLKKAEKIADLPAFEKVYHAVHIASAMQKAQNASIKNELEERILKFYNISFEDALLYLEKREIIFSRNCLLQLLNNHKQKMLWAGVFTASLSALYVIGKTEPSFESTAIDVLYCKEQNLPIQDWKFDIPQYAAVNFVPSILSQESPTDFLSLFSANALKWGIKLLQTLLPSSFQEQLQISSHSLESTFSWNGFKSTAYDYARKILEGISSFFKNAA